MENNPANTLHQPVAKSTSEPQENTMADYSDTITSFPFLSDDETIAFITRTKIMFIMRGLPGSGKSTIAKLIKSRYPTAVSVSADDHFMKGGVYAYDREGLQDAHMNCQQKARELAAAGTNPIIIDNTNLLRRFMRVYFDIAREYGYIDIIVSPKTEWWKDLDQLVAMNSHGLTMESLKKKEKIFKDVYPLYWAWFFGDGVDGMSLTDEAERLFPICLRSIPELYHYLRYHSKESVHITFDALYSAGQPPRRGRVLHCTAFFAGPDGKDNPQVVAYANSDIVRSSTGKSFPLTIVGMIITPRTVGARVILTQEEMRLWKNDLSDVKDLGSDIGLTDGNENNDTSASSDTGNSCRSTSDHQHLTSSQVESIKQVKDKSVSSLGESVDFRNSPQDSGSYQAVDKLRISDNVADKVSDSLAVTSPHIAHTVTDSLAAVITDNAKLTGLASCNKKQIDNVSDSRVESAKVPETLPASSRVDNVRLPSGSRAHVTLGCAEGVEAVQTGIDLIDILLCEEQGKIVGEPVRVDGMTLSYYGDGRCLIMFDESRCIQSIFNGAMLGNNSNK